MPCRSLWSLRDHERCGKLSRLEIAVRGSACAVSPYRFLVLSALLGPWIVAMALERTRGWQRTLLCIVFYLFGSRAQGVSYTVYLCVGPVPQDATRPMTPQTVVANERMPKWVSDVPLSRPVETLEVVDGDSHSSHGHSPVRISTWILRHYGCHCADQQSILSRLE